VVSAFIPVYSKYLTRGEQEEGWDLVSILFNLSVVVLVPLVLVGILVAPFLMRLLEPDMPPQYQLLAADLARIFFFAPVFFTLGCFSTSLLNAHNRFFLASLAPTSYNLGIIFGALVLSNWLGIYGVALGALLGSILYFLVQVPGLVLIGFSYRPLLSLGHTGVRAIARLMGPRAIGLAVYQVNFLVLLNLASGISGGNSALTYAWTLTMLPLGVFAMAISTAVFPSLAEQSATENHDELRRTLEQALRFILYLTIPAIVGLAALSPQIVRLIYQRGAFTAQSTALTAGALRFFALGLLGMAAVEIVTRAFYALHDTKTPVKVAALAMVVNLSLGIVLVRVMGLNGLALAMAVASTVEGVVLYTLGRRRIPGMAASSLAGSALRSLAAAALMGLVILAFRAVAAPLAVPLSGLLLVASAIALGGLVYLAATLALGSSEASHLRILLPRK
jgi:putative peptidoglycan lipid II flippase